MLNKTYIFSEEEIANINDELINIAKSLYENKIISDELYDKFKYIRKHLTILISEDTKLVSFKKFNSHYGFLTIKNYPQDIKNIISKYFSIINILDFNTNESIFLINQTHQMIKADICISSQKIIDIYNEIADKDEQFAEKYLCIKAHISQRM